MTLARVRPRRPPRGFRSARREGRYRCRGEWPSASVLNRRLLIDARADVYGLGATLFHLLTGEAPFTGATAINIFSKVLSTEVPLPSSLRAGIDARLDEVCRTCLAKEPEERYASMAALQEALRAWREPTSSSLGCVAGLLALGTLALALGIAAVVSSSAPPTPAEEVEPVIPSEPAAPTVQPPPSTRHRLAWDSTGGVAPARGVVRLGGRLSRSGAGAAWPCCGTRSGGCAPA